MLGSRDGAHTGARGSLQTLLQGLPITYATYGDPNVKIVRVSREESVDAK